MFEPIKNAELQPSDIAKLLKLSRVTVSMWLNGHAAPHKLHVERVQNLVDAVNRAVEAGQLPVPVDVTRRERGLYIQKALEPFWTDDRS